MIHPNIKFLRSVGMLIGAIIGVGVFGLPYAFAQAGTAIGLLWLILIGGMLTILLLMMAEISVQTPGKERLVGLAERYLGTPWKWLTIVAMATSIWGAMLAYMLIGGKFLHLLLSPMLGGPEMIYSLGVWFVSATLIYRGLGFAAKYEVAIVIALLFLFAFIILLSLPEISLSNYSSVDFSQVLVPYGVILFSLGGIGIIPEMEDFLGNKAKKLLAPSVIAGMVVILLLYGLFSLAVVGVTGPETSSAAFDGLIPIFGETFRFVSTLLGSMAILSIYMILGVQMMNTYRFDFKMKHNTAWFLTVIVPITLYLLGFREFISLIGFIGGVLGGTIGILVSLIYWKMRRSPVCTEHHCINYPAILTWVLIAMFAGGIVAQIVSLLV